MKRLYSSDKYELAELSIYAHPKEPRLKEIPWITYPNAPLPDNKEATNKYNSNGVYQFGEWRFEEVLLDFKPDIVFDIRDFWMLEFEERSPFRDLFHWAIMPTVDAEGQNEQWLATYANANAVFTYSDWAVDTLNNEGGNLISCLGSAPPSADEVYKPVADKDENRRSLDLDLDAKIIGTIMRNQRRKLFPDLFDAFRKFLNSYGKTNVFLYCHTSYPDVGWDIPKLLKEYGLCSKVIFTYVCESCANVFPSFFHDAVSKCPRCGEFKAGLANVQRGASPEILAKIINTFDLYVQYANSEGFGLPQVEAAACGVPVMSVDYSAMQSVIRKLGGTPLKLKTKYLELETGCMRAIPDNDYTAKKFQEFFEMTDKKQSMAGERSRKRFLKHYQYDTSAKKWADHFDSVVIKEGIWESPPRLHSPPNSAPNDLNNRDLAKWLIVNVLGEPDQLDTYLEARLIRDLNYGVFIEGTSSLYFNEDSFAYGRPAFREFNLQEAYNQLSEIRDRKNYWEQRRVGMIQEPRPPWMP